MAHRGRIDAQCSRKSNVYDASPSAGTLRLHTAISKHYVDLLPPGLATAHIPSSSGVSLVVLGLLLLLQLTFLKWGYYDFKFLKC
jgi:hypothetical protein